MVKPALALILGLAGFPLPQVGQLRVAPVAPLFDNERVTVWDVTSPGGLPDPRSLQTDDVVVVSLAPPSTAGHMAFVKKGTASASNLVPAGSTRTAIVRLKDHVVAPLGNTSGYPNAFPRPGTNKKVFENARIVAWDYTFAPGQATPMHFHDKDAVTCYLETGAVIGTAPDGQVTPNVFAAGTVRFNPRARTHTETLTGGRSRIIAIELK